MTILTIFVNNQDFYAYNKARIFIFVIFRIAKIYLYYYYIIFNEPFQ